MSIPHGAFSHHADPKHPGMAHVKMNRQSFKIGFPLFGFLPPVHLFIEINVILSTIISDRITGQLM